jgi:putative transposase
MQQHQYSVQRACSVVGVPRSIYYYTSRRDDSQIIDALQQHVAKHYTHGFPKTFAYLRKAGFCWNHKRVHRVYKELKLNLRRKGKRRLPARVKQPLHQPTAINQSWSIDFMHDRLINGRAFRTFNAMDDYNREILAIEIDTSLTASRVIRTLEQVIAYRGKPQQIRMDNGPEFISHQFELWCREKQIKLQYIQPGKPMQNGFIERFNGTYRRDILDAYLFEELWQVKQLTAEFIEEYNERRPHKSLNDLTPHEYLLKYGQLSNAHGTAKDLTTFQQVNNNNDDENENQN